jgi:hypothetical protein
MLDKRSEFQQKAQECLSLIEASQKREQDTLTEINESDIDSAMLRLDLTDEMASQTSLYLAIYDASFSILKKKDEDSMNNARKALNKCLNYAESVVTKTADAPFSTYEKQLEEIAEFSPAERYELVQKIDSVITQFKKAFGTDPKWKGTIVEFDGRLAIITKNILNLRDVVANTDPRSPNYEPTLYHVRFAKKLLTEAADRYRQKYEGYSKSIDDFKIAISFVRALAMFDLFTGDQADAELQKKKLAVWKNKLNADIKTQQSKKR